MASNELRHTRGLLVCLALVCVLVFPPRALCEQDELTLGAEAGLLLPDYSPKAATAFTVATWTAGVVVSHGVLDDLSLTAQFNFSLFSAMADDYSKTVDGLEYEGSLDFSGRLYHPQIGARYKVFSGYNLAPYVEAALGYAWTTVHRPKIVNDAGQVYGLDLNDWGEGTVTVSGGLVVDYRVANTAMVGLTGRFVYALQNTLLNWYTIIGVQAQYYW